MKKVLLPIFIFAVAISARGEKTQPSFSNLPAETNVPSTYSVADDILDIKAAGAAAMAEEDNSIESYEGEYTWNLYSYMTQNFGYTTSQLSIKIVDKSTGEVAISGWPQSYVVKGFIDTEAKTLSIPNNQNLGPDKNNDLNFFYIKRYDDNGQIIPGMAPVSASVGTIDGKKITFPILDMWVIGNYRNEDLGFWSCSTRNSLKYFDPNEGWEDFGTATFIDGWVLHGYNMDPTQYPWQVEIQRYAYNDKQFRLKNPYQAEGFPREKANEGFIYFDISDPEFVIVYPNYYSGYNNKQDQLYLFNLEGYYIQQGFTKEEIINAFKNGVNAFSSYKDGVATIHNCCFDIKNPATQRYTWVNKSGVDLKDIMIAKITIDKLVSSSGIADIEIDDNSTPVYYNLQGMRINNPEKNQLVIRSLNGKVSKVIIK
ncbi:MAG: hypothetical protein K2M98_08310 [Muribaculum sp.]|nr:hypothetical protein [Muribaculum sp.]